MKSQRWYSPALQRDRERMELEREATRLIRSADRQRRRRASSPAKRPEQPLQTKNGWVSGLTNLRRAMRAKRS